MAIIVENSNRGMQRRRPRERPSAQCIARRFAPGHLPLPPFSPLLVTGPATPEYQAVFCQVAGPEVPQPRRICLIFTRLPDLRISSGAVHRNLSVEKNFQRHFVQNLIHEIRGKKVMLDFDLAKLYQVETRSLNQTVKRNIKRFPPDFMFQITADEWNANSSQSVMTSNRPKMAQNVRSSVPELRLREAAVPFIET